MRPEGEITRGTTSPGRLRRVDRWITQAQRAVLRASESSALRSGTKPAQAFIDGYHSGLWLAIGLLATGVVLSYVTLRPRKQSATDQLAAELGLAEHVEARPADISVEA